MSFASLHRPPLRQRAAHLAALTLLLLAAAACGGGSTTATKPVVNGHPIVPIDPNRPGDLLFQSGLDLYNRAFAEQVAATNARLANDPTTAAAQDALAVTDYAAARAKFDQLDADATLCPAVSIRCDHAAYLGGRCSYEVGTINTDQPSFADAQTRLDAMLAAFPASAFVDSANYFDGRARFELKLKFGAGTYADAEPFFERAYAAAPAGTWADNAAYYDGRCEFEEGYALVAPGTALLTQPQYDQARSLFDQAIGAEGTLLSRFATSTYRDNADYYLGRAWLEKPTPDVAPGVTPGTVSDAERVANLGHGIDALTQVVNGPKPTFVPGAHYWRGRGHYDLWFHQTGTIVNTELDLALADFHAVAATSVWRDNALYYAVKADIHEANAAAACADYADLAANFAGSTYTTKAAAALTTAAITCP